MNPLMIKFSNSGRWTISLIPRTYGKALEISCWENGGENAIVTSFTTNLILKGDLIKLSEAFIEISKYLPEKE
jgi:hypothetical protein